MNKGGGMTARGAGFFQRPELSAIEREREDLKAALRVRLGDCRVRRESARRLCAAHRNRDALMLLESLLGEVLGVLEALEPGETLPGAGNFPARAAALPDPGAGAMLRDAWELAVACGQAPRLSKKERKGLKRLLSATGRVLRCGERAFARTARASLTTPMDGYRARRRGMGWAVLAVPGALAAMILWGPLGNLLGARSVDLIRDGDGPYARAESLSEVERSEVVQWRWGLGPETRVSFVLDGDQEVGVDIRFVSYLYQTVTLEANDQVLRVIDDVFPEGLIEEALHFRGRDGDNVVLIRYSDWNHKADQAPQPGDPRPTSVALVKLRISAERPLLEVR